MTFFALLVATLQITILTNTRFLNRFSINNYHYLRISGASVGYEISRLVGKNVAKIFHRRKPIRFHCYVLQSCLGTKLLTAFADDIVVD